MPVAAVFFVIGFAVGWVRASRRGGTQADRLQWGVAHAIPAGILGLVLAIALAGAGG